MPVEVAAKSMWILDFQLPTSNYQFSSVPLMLQSAMANRKLTILLLVTCFFGHELLIVSGGKQCPQLAGILQRDLHHPRAMRIFVHFLRRCSQIPVDLGDRPR